MPALMKTEFTASVVYIGYVADRDAALASAPATHLDLTFAGYDAEAHAGETRASCSRVKDLYPRGTEIRNTRQLSIVSQEELGQIARNMGIDHLNPEWLGASIMINGFSDFTHIPPSTRLRAPSGATITIDMENRPCIFPGKSLETEYPGQGAKFGPAARDRRGVTAWVAAEGALALGDRLRLHVPDQPLWAPGLPLSD